MNVSSAPDLCPSGRAKRRRLCAANHPSIHHPVNTLLTLVFSDVGEVSRRSGRRHRGSRNRPSGRGPVIDKGSRMMRFGPSRPTVSGPERLQGKARRESEDPRRCRRGPIETPRQPDGSRHRRGWRTGERTDDGAWAGPATTTSRWRPSHEKRRGPTGRDGASRLRGCAGNVC